MKQRVVSDNTIVFTHSTLPDRDSLRSRRGEVSEFLELWKSGGAVPDAKAALAARPEWAGNKGIVLDLAYEEYCLQAERGDPPDVHEFARRFPDYEMSLLHLLGVHQVLSFTGVELPDDVEWPEPGDSYLGFRLVEELGRGGFARVFLAEEEELDNRQVVVKLSTLGVDEGCILARLPHDNIVPIHSIRSDDERGITLICMPYLGRHTLWDVWSKVEVQGVPKSTLPFGALLGDASPVAFDAKADRPEAAFSTPYTEFVVRTGIAVAEALDHAHAAGVCHGDIKPSNILLTTAGEPMLLDFNLAVKGDEAPSGGGTLPYMAPEQLAALVPAKNTKTIVTPQTDLFSLGTVLYELFTGQHPFGLAPQSASRSEFCSQLVELRRRRPRPMRDFAPSIDAELERCVLKCLSFAPAERPRTAGEVAEGLRRSLRFSRRARRWLQAHRRAVRVGCAMLFAAMFLLAYMAYRRESYPIREWRAGMDAFQKGDMPQASSHAAAALAANPRFADARILHARAAQGTRDFAIAVTDYHSAYEELKLPMLLAGEAYACQQAGRHKEAIAMFNEAISGGFDKSAEVWNDLGYSQLQDGKEDDAAHAFNVAVGLDSTLRAALYNRAELEIDRSLDSGTRISEQARIDIDAALASGPPSAEMYQTAAMIYQLLQFGGNDAHGKEIREQARALLAKAIEYGLPRAAAEQNPLLSGILPPASSNTGAKSITKSLPVVRIVDPLPANLTLDPALSASP